VYAWGLNYDGQCGVVGGGRVPFPQAVSFECPGFRCTAKEIAAGGGHSLALVQMVSTVGEEEGGGVENGGSSSSSFSSARVWVWGSGDGGLGVWHSSHAPYDEGARLEVTREGGASSSCGKELGGAHARGYEDDPVLASVTSDAHLASVAATCGVRKALVAAAVRSQGSPQRIPVHPRVAAATATSTASPRFPSLEPLLRSAVESGACEDVTGAAGDVVVSCPSSPERGLAEEEHLDLSYIHPPPLHRLTRWAPEPIPLQQLLQAAPECVVEGGASVTGLAAGQCHSLLLLDVPLRR
jgi:hypothetical protein